MTGKLTGIKTGPGLFTPPDCGLQTPQTVHQIGGNEKESRKAACNSYT
jgi:hypothetical protein